MNNTDTKTFTTVEDKTKPFNDGIFGRATSKALVKYKINHAKKFPQDIKVKDTKRVGQDPLGKVEKSQKVPSPSDIKIKTGTQPLQK